MTDFIMQPWPWWFSGILVGLTVPLLYILAGQGFGISTSLQQLGAMCSPHSNLSYFKDFNKRKGMWTLLFAVGIAFGGFIATRFLTAEPVEFLPESYMSLGGAIRLLIGGILIGFGTRYAGGCTSGHAITGIANLNWPSLVATIFFFVGGLGVTWGLGSLIF
ncbi:YeeE/YedE family protein [Vicingaceae bacterium]|nr:YeeE/YedE family protein [Vicingaceae bacterium]